MRIEAVLACSATLMVLLDAVGASYEATVTCTIKDDTVTIDDCYKNITENFQKIKSTCDREYYEMAFNVTNVTKGTYCSKVSLDVNFTCASHLGILAYKVNKEICDLHSCGGITLNRSNVWASRITPTAAFSKDLESNISITLENVGEVLYIAAAVTKWRKDTDITVKDTGIKSYNRFLLAEEAPVVVVEMETESNKLENLAIGIKMSTKAAPLSFLPEDVYVAKVKKLCAYYDANGSHGRWDHSVCNATVIGSETFCKCRHNSAFAIIFAMRDVDVGDGMKAFSTVLEVISMISLLLTVVLLGIYRKKLRDFDRVLVQISLCLALLCAHLFFVASPLAVGSDNACVALTVVTHYFVVATALLMVTEGALMLTKVLAPNVFSSSSSTKKRWRIAGFLITWIFPMLYACLCAAIGISASGVRYANWVENLGRHQACWLSVRYMPVVVIPVALALAINIGIAIRLGVLVWKMSKTAENFKPTHQRNNNPSSHARKALRAVAILMPILGIPWIIGFLMNIENAELVFMSMHLLVNGLQGTLLFFYYIVFNTDLRSNLQQSWKVAMSNIGTSNPTVRFSTNKDSSSEEVKVD